MVTTPRRGIRGRGGGGNKSFDFLEDVDDDTTTTPDDIQIEVKIPDIDQKMRARQESKRYDAASSPNQPRGGYMVNHPDERNLPEWLIKQRQREANVKRKQEEREDKMASLIQAHVRGYKARQGYQQLKIEHYDRILAMKERERRIQRKHQASIQIQKTWRRVMPRKRFLYLKECRRRREKNEKEIKRITKVISKMPKKTKTGELLWNWKLCRCLWLMSIDV